MRYDERTVDQVQSASNIVDVISQYVKLKKAGRNYKGLCPFHGEKTPSFMVQPEKQIFHCFGCNVGGDVFGFIMKYENLSFPEAIRQLAERAGIDLPKFAPRGGDDGGAGESDKLYEIYKHACDFYHAKFKSPDGKAAREYFLKRGFTMEIAEEFKIGWAPDSWRELLEFLGKKGYPDTLLLKSALINRSPSKGTLYDAFRGRLLFPIQNLHGKVVAFGGRILKDAEGQPKYLNSPEHPIFHKRKELFGLHQAKKHINRENPRIQVVEGYLDFLGLYQAGFKNTVATLGTALGDDHVQVLKRFVDEAIVVYDGDKAGEAASMRGLEIFLEGGLNVRIARMPAGFDPDDFVQKKGNEAFQKILDEARDFFDYKLEILLTRYNRLDSLGLMKITGDFLETFSKIESPVLVDRYLRKLASSLGVEENSLRTELNKLKKKTSDKAPPQGSAPVKPVSVPVRSSQVSEEVVLLLLALEDAKLRQLVFEQLTESDFSEVPSKTAFRALQEMQTAGERIVWPQILNRIEHEPLKQKLVAVSSLDWNDNEKQQALDDCFKTLYKRRNQKRLEELRRLIAKADLERDTVKMGEFMKEYQSLWKQTL